MRFSLDREENTQQGKYLQGLVEPVKKATKTRSVLYNRQIHVFMY